MAATASSNMLHHIRAAIIRGVTYLFSLLDRYCSTPIAGRHSFKLQVPVTGENARRGSIDLLFYLPPGMTRRQLAGKSLPAVLNVHGGGWGFGTPQMDARWCTYAASNAGVVVISVGYRLAPKHPFPGPIDDVEDAVRWVAAHGPEVGVDPLRVVLSGFSAGGNMVVAVALRQGRANVSRKEAHERPQLRIRGILAVYPLLDRSSSIEEKRASMPAANQTRSRTPAWLDFRWAYLPAGRDYDYKNDTDLSPGLATDDMILNWLPAHVGIWTCELDVLSEEGEKFRKRLHGLGKKTSGRMIPSERHAWDRYPTYRRGNPEMNAMHVEMTTELKAMVSDSD